MLNKNNKADADVFKPHPSMQNIKERAKVAHKAPVIPADLVASVKAEYGFPSRKGSVKLTICELALRGYSRASVKNAVNRSYQHVRNVCEKESIPNSSKT